MSTFYPRSLADRSVNVALLGLHCIARNAHHTMKGEESSPLNGASLDNKDERGARLVLETFTSAFGTDFMLVKAGRKKGYVRAAYLVAP